MPTPLQQIQVLLPKLDAGDRKKLSLLLNKFSGGVSPRASMNLEADWLFCGIRSELARRGLVYRVREISELRKIAPNYELDAEVVRVQLEKLLRVKLPQPKRAQLMTLGGVAARALTDYLSPVATVGLKMALNNVGKTLEAIDTSFPGYMSCGMTYCLISPL